MILKRIQKLIIKKKIINLYVYKNKNNIKSLLKEKLYS